MKYVVFKSWVCSQVPIIFPDFLNHADVVRQLGFTKDDVFSAGEVWVTDRADVVCSGASTSLGIKCHPDDSANLQRMLSRG